MGLDPKVWGPHYWFVLHTIAMGYPIHPNSMTKKKYYEFVVYQMPLFIPIESMASGFSKLINEYPVLPYLDSRDSFIRWMHFIHNKVNEQLEKKQISLGKFYENYYEQYKSKDEKNRDYYKLMSKVIYLTILLFIIFAIYYLYNI